MGNYQALAEDIIENVGGKDNVNSVVHCITRLRFKLKDESKANTEVLENMEGVVTVMKAGGQYQVVIGNHVPAVFEDVTQLLGFEQATDADDGNEEKGSIFNRLIDVLSGVFQPFLGVLAASGMIKGLNAMFLAFGWITASSGTYLMLNAIGDAIFTFIPIVVGMAAARKFKIDAFLGLVLGAALVYPAIQTQTLQAAGDPIGVLFKGTFLESPYYTTFLNIPFITQNYSGTVVPVLVTVWLASVLHKRLKRVIPEMLQSFFVPFFTLLITMPIALMVIGPILNIATNLLSSGFQALLGFNPIIFMALAAFVWQVMVIFGLHWALVSIAIVQTAQLGYNQILSSIFAVCFAQVAVVFALWLKFKKEDKTLHTLGIPAMISGLAGVTEPAIYGITLKRKKAFLFSMIGGGASGAVLGLINARNYTLGGLGVFGLPSFVGPDGNLNEMYMALVSIVVAVLVAFLLTWFFYGAKDEVKLHAGEPEKPEQEAKALPSLKSEAIELPLMGQVKSLETASDQVFASGAMGKGILVEPTDGEIIAPFDGEVVTVFPTGHAIGLRSDSGVELLIHIGMDTVQLEGKHFEKLVNDGDRVTKGQVLIRFDKEAIKADGYLVETPVLVTNTDSYNDVLTHTDGKFVIETIA
ncbi:beta-glucoside-specific PTS transporter subunit IIABC [Lactococcus termiticola]|uniref:PTS system sucrose-specific EIIBCA component n=1 Tax=Lactococcus termiticola TaxID=2169526 RepID=A0A2R5HG78_9LACT|nr:beta-glucoside-specific PTS transporter subunit IIABC [Lactococcus termiticola]GBG97067.1 beta-glucoside-specific PTS system IIABC component [Lactococcus termiticola]